MRRMLCLLMLLILLPSPGQAQEEASSIPGIPRVYVTIGLNWFGLETEQAVPGGVVDGLTVSRQLGLMRRLGARHIRLPVSAWTLRGHPTDARAQARGYPADSREGLEQVLRLAGDAGMQVLLTHYNFDPSRTGANQIGRPFSNPADARTRCSWCADGQYDKADWLADLEDMARLSLRYPAIMGIEVTNEPHSLDWVRWRPLAEEAGARILAVNPQLDIYVPGLFGHTEDRVHWSHWGEWHRGFLDQPIDPARIPRDRLVLSIHTYSPQFTRPPLDPKSYHVDPRYPANMPAIWDVFFGDVAKQGVRMALTEFAMGRIEGTDLFQDTAEIQWADILFYYLKQRGLGGPHFFWSWNADSVDTLNLLTRDLSSIRADLALRLFGPR